MKLNSKRILCLVLPSLQAGGMERVMSELAGYFCQHNNLEVHLILYGKNPELHYGVPENIFVHKPVTYFNERFRTIYTLGRMVFLRQTIKKINPDSVLSFGEYWNSFVLLALFGLSCPVYISDRCSPSKKYSKFHSMLRKLLYPLSKGIIAQTEKARNLYMDQFRNNNICVIGNPIRQIPVIQNSIKDENIVLSVGRLIKSKNHDRLVELFSNIDNPDWKLVIVGGDALKQNNMSRLKDLIRSLNAESRIILTGYTTDLDKFYRESSIFAFTSESEGFPNVIGEALSASLPVVSFDCIAGPSEMISDGENGYLIPVNDYVLFSKRLEQLMTDKSLREMMGSKAKESIKKFSLESIGLKYREFILAN